LWQRLKDEIMAFESYSGNLIPQSIVQHGEQTYALAHDDQGNRVLLVESASGAPDGFAIKPLGNGILIGDCSPQNAAALRRALPWLAPQPLHLQTSFGFGDRMGSATPGHIDAMRTTGAEGIIAPIFAQQSVRENTRTHRTPQEVMDAALWAILQEGWTLPWGADADHVKQVSDLPDFVAAGYTFYTIDPSDHVDNDAENDTPADLRDKVNRLPWEALGTTWAETHTRYCTESFTLGSFDLVFDEETLLRALAKYGRAIVHTIEVARSLSELAGAGRYELEMSVDETETPTSTHEHFFIANELLARDLPIVSLAPRFVGKFQKGVDYMGDLDLFITELARHAAIRDHFDRYKISIHTGSDKFSIYPAIAAATHGRVHVKTAGTSYLEALRVIARVNPPLFRQILDDARSVFERDRHSYFLDAELANVPDSADLEDADLPALLDHFDSRQVLHVAFGTILVGHGEAIAQEVTAHEAEFRTGLEKHFARHLAPFVNAPIQISE